MPTRVAEKSSIANDTVLRSSRKKKMHSYNIFCFNLRTAELILELKNYSD